MVQTGSTIGAKPAETLGFPGCLACDRYSAQWEARDAAVSQNSVAAAQRYLWR